MAGVVKDGKVVLPPSVKLPEGAVVRVMLDVAVDTGSAPFDREALTWEDVESDLLAAKRIRFAK